MKYFTPKQWWETIIQGDRNCYFLFTPHCWVHLHNVKGQNLRAGWPSQECLCQGWNRLTLPAHCFLFCPWLFWFLCGPSIEFNLFFLSVFFCFFFLWSKHSLSLCLRVSMVKNLPAMQQTWVWPQDQEDPLEKEMETHSSILAWRIPWTEKPGRLQSMGLQRVKHDWATNTAHISFWIYFTLLHPQDNGRESPISYLWRLWGSSQDTQWCWPYREQVHLPKTTPQPSLCARQERAEGGGRGPSVFCVTYHRQQNINWDPVLWLLNSEHFLPSNTHFKQNTTLIKVTILFMTSLAWVMENPLAWVMEK